MGLATFDFEKPILEVERQIEYLTSQKSNPKISRKITELEKSLHELKVQIYGNLTPWQRVQLARHMARPHSLDFIKAIFNNWT